MKVIIAGSRKITESKVLTAAINDFCSTGDTITEVVCGHARGVDRMGLIWGKMQGLKIADFPADWDTHGKSAGHIRNAAMARYADQLIAIWDGKSKGTKNMILEMFKRGKPVFLVVYAEKIDRIRDLLEGISKYITVRAIKKKGIGV